MIDGDKWIFDLGAAKEDIGRRPWGKKLAGRISAYIDANSSLIDLKSAAESVDLAAELNQTYRFAKDNEDFIPTRHMGAHVIASIILYMRATETSSKQRRQLPVSEWYDPDLKLAHKRIKALRNGAVGHFGYGYEEGHQVWVSETALFEVSEKPLVKFVYSRASMLHADTMLLVSLLAVAIPKCQELVDSRRRDLGWELEGIGPDKLMPIVERYHFDPATIYPGPDPAGSFNETPTTPSGVIVGWSIPPKFSTKP